MALTRMRMQHLLADFHSIYPTQSTWSDAQRLMARWGRWGHYDGTCTAADCDYNIVIADPSARWAHTPYQRWTVWMNGSRFYTLIARLGWRAIEFSVRFVVQDGKIVRTRTCLVLAVNDSGPPGHDSLGLSLNSQVRARLRNPLVDADKERILGGDEQLDDHPDYKVGGPFCSGCEYAEVSYTPTLPHSKLLDFTAYDFSCLTRFYACTHIGDLLSAAHDWHLYDRETIGLTAAHSDAISCRTEPRALGRDAEDIVEVESLLVEKRIDTSQGDPITLEVARVRLLHVIKGIFGVASGSSILIVPFSGSTYSEPIELPEHLLPRHRYFVFLDHRYRSERGEFGADRCGVLDDTPANLAALQTGIAQDVTYRRPPKFGD
jgi:hypothetical protein